VVSRWDFVCIFQTGEAGRRKSVGGLYEDLFAGRQQSINSQQDCRMMKLVELLVQSDNRFSRRADRDSTMVTKGHRHGKRKSQEEKLTELRADIEKIALKIPQDKEPIWVYEWPMKEAKSKMSSQGVDGQMTAEAVEEVVEVCKPETGRSLDDFENELGSSEDLKNCQEGREVEILDFQEGNYLRSAEDLIDCQEDIQGISHC
jgi:hypothetical protein